MKTKQLKFLSLLFALLAFSCSKEELQVDHNTDLEITSKSAAPENLSKNLDLQENKSSTNSLPNTTNSTTTLPGGETDVYYLFLNMDIIESDYNNDPNSPIYTGPFNIHYRNLMSNHFTIYNVTESTNATCGNIERWIVDLDEFNQYLVSIGLPEVDAGGNDWYINGDTSGGDTSTTMLDVNGKKKKGTPPPPPPNVPSWLVNYNHCFTM